MTYQRSLQWVSMITAVLCTVWFATSLLDPFNIPKLAILVVGAAALVGLLAGTVKLWWRKDSMAVTAVVGLFLLGLTAAAVAADQNVYRTLWGAWARNDGWLAYASLAVIALAVAVGFRGRDARFGMYSLIVAGYVQVGYSLLQTTGNDPVHWNNGYNAILGTVGNPNFASALLGISAVAMCWIALDAEFHIVNRVAHAFIALVAVWLTIRSDSIQGTLAWGAGFAILIATSLTKPERNASLRALFWPYVSVLGLGGVVAALGFVGTGPLGAYLDTQNLKNREYYWKTAWHMFQDHKFFGVGLDSFGDFYRTYRALDPVGAPGFDTTTNAAHSIVFQMLATGGLALFGTYFLLQLFVAGRAVIAFRSGEQRVLVGGAAGAWVAFLLQSLFSIDQLGLTVWGWVLSGLVIGVSYAPPGELQASRKPQRGRAPVSDTISGNFVIAGVAAAMLGLGAVLLVSAPLSTERDLKLATSYAYDASQPNAAEIKSAITQAVSGAVAYAQDPYWRAVAVSKLYQISAIDEGVRLAEVSANEFPLDVTLWQLVATAYEQTGRASQAVAARTKTVELDPLNTDYQTLLAQDKAAK